GDVLTASAAARVGGAWVTVLRAEDLVVYRPQGTAARACGGVARNADWHGTVLAGPAALVQGNVDAGARNAAIVRACDPVVTRGVVQAAAGKRRADADARVAAVGDRAVVPVVARAAVELGGVRARAGRRVAGPRVVTLVGRGADDGVPARAHAGLAGVGPRAGVAVGARAPVGLGGVRACTGRRVARPRVVTLVGGGAYDGRRAGAHSRLTGVGLRARVAVGTRGALGLGGVRSRAGRLVAGPRAMTVVGRGADDRMPSRAHAGLAGIGSRAGVAVGARAPVGLGGIRARAGRRVAGPCVVTLVGCGADDGISTRAHAALAGVGPRARVAVGARAPVGLGGIRARAGRRVAGPRVVTLVGCGADNGVPDRAPAGRACVVPRAGVAVGARVAVGFGGIRARAGRRVAGPRVVTLVGRGADDRISTRAHAALAGVGLCARVAVVADAPVGLGGVRARAGRRVAGPRVVTL